ncbi:hypothetical protein E2C01_072855 [Portunus trituberculatus]|uniref:Uncharacterized protein n=1 Tax=Portunus trituberculatus TaxID=210409 RepID=A0A5B7I170_PORTR|nr:hypothetical protein [Portunus trituberculatus]
MLPPSPAFPGCGVAGSSSRCPSPPPPSSQGSVSVKGVVVAAAARYRYSQTLMASAVLCMPVPCAAWNRVVGIDFWTECRTSALPQCVTNCIALIEPRRKGGRRGARWCQLVRKAWAAAAAALLNSPIAEVVAPPPSANNQQRINWAPIMVDMAGPAKRGGWEDRCSLRKACM